MKTCSKCKEEKAITEFSHDKSRKDGLEHKCKTCKAVMMRDWRRRNPHTPIDDLWRKDFEYV